MGAYAPLCNPTMWWTEHCRSMDAILHIFGTLLLLLLLQPTSGKKSTMGIATCSPSRPKPIQKATTAKTPTPNGGKLRSEHQLSKSPRSVNINRILADINLPMTRFETILTVLGHAAERNGKMEDNPTPPEDNNPVDKEADEANPPSNQVSPPTSPNLDPTDNTTVRINETPDSNPPMSNPSTTTTSQSILRGATLAEMTDQTTTEATEFQPIDSPSRKTILDRHRKHLISLGEDRHNKTFHVEDFVGLYPAWPIVEVAISPTGNAKEERMNMFVKCITSLFGEILYVDNTATICPLEITDDNKENYITNKAKLPSNFTKLGKWIMISEGSWVFSKKVKGSSDVYVQFCLKSQVPTEEVSN
jgi:hypothetical protein